jgi:hypothetical protein
MYEPTVILKRRVVEKVGQNFVVMECQADGWHAISKAYPASTSAYAKLGRITHLDTKQDDFNKKSKKKSKATEELSE